MAYNSQYDLRGKRIQDTYTQVVQYDTSSGVTYTGQGASLDNFSASFAATASRALTAAFANTATSASFAPPSPNASASYASQADNATSSSYSSVADYAVSSGTASYASNVISSSYATNASQSNRIVITDIGNTPAEHAVVFQSTTNTNTLVTNGGGTSLFSFNPGTNTLKAGIFLGNLTGSAQSSSYAGKAQSAAGVQGEPNTNVTVTSVGSGRMNVWGNGMSVTSVSDTILTANGDITLSSSFSNVNVTAPDGMHITSSGVYVSGNDPTSENGVIYVWSWEGNTFHGLNVNDNGFIFGNLEASNITVGSTIAAQGNIRSIFGSISASAGFSGNLIGTASWATNVVNGVNQVSVSWASSSLSTSYVKVPGPSVLINDVDNPTGFYNTALGAYALSSSIVNESVAGENTAVGGYALGNLTFGDGNTAVGDYAVAEIASADRVTALGAYTIINDGLSNVTVIGAETQGVQNNTVILGNNADVGVGTNTPQTKLHVSGTVSASAFRTEYNGFDSGLTVGGIDVESNDNTNGFIGWNAIDVGGGKVKKTDGPSGVIEVSAPSMYFKMSVSDVSGSSAAGPTQVRIDGIGNNVSLGGSINTGFVPTGARLFVSGSGLVGINNITPTEALDITGNERVSGFVRAGQGFTGSLSASTITASCATVGQVWIDTYYVYGTASYANTASVAVTSSYTPITVQGNGSSLDQYIPFVQSSGSVDKLFVDSTNDLRYNPTDGLLTVTHISASCITGSAQSGYVAFLGTASWSQNSINALTASTINGSTGSNAPANQTTASAWLPIVVNDQVFYLPLYQ